MNNPLTVWLIALERQKDLLRSSQNDSLARGLARAELRLTLKLREFLGQNMIRWGEKIARRSPVCTTSQKGSYHV